MLGVQPKLFMKIIGTCGHLLYVEIFSTCMSDPQRRDFLEENNVIIELSGEVHDILATESLEGFSAKYDLVIIPGHMFADHDQRHVSSVIRGYAQSRGYKQLSVADACIVRQHLTNENIRELGFEYLVFMHEPKFIPSDKKDPFVLKTNRAVSNSRDKLEAEYENPMCGWGNEAGLVFIRVKENIG